MKCLGTFKRRTQPLTIPTVYCCPHDLSHISPGLLTMFVKDGIFCCTKICLDLRHQRKSDSKHLYLQYHTHPAFIAVGVSGFYTRSRRDSRHDRKYRALSHPQFCRNDVRNLQTCCGPFRDHYWWVRLWPGCPIITPKGLWRRVVQNETKETWETLHLTFVTTFVKLSVKPLPVFWRLLIHYAKYFQRLIRFITAQ